MDDYYMTYFSPRGMQCVYKGISLQCWKENRKTTSQLQRERKPDIICQILLSKSVLCVASGKKNALDIKAFVLQDVSYCEKKSPGHQEESHRIYVLLEDWEESKGFWYLKGYGSVTKSRML